MSFIMNKILKEQFFVDNLSAEQEAVISNMNAYIGDGLKQNDHRVAIIQGAAGTGKSVVLMNLVTKYMTDKRYKTALVVNHPELFKAYKDLAVDIPGMRDKDITRPTPLINNAQKRNWQYDVIFVDEAHLLLSKPEPYMHYNGENQLADLMSLAQGRCRCLRFCASVPVKDVLGQGLVV